MDREGRGGGGGDGDEGVRVRRGAAYGGAMVWSLDEGGERDESVRGTRAAVGSGAIRRHWRRDPRDMPMDQSEPSKRYDHLNWSK